MWQYIIRGQKGRRDAHSDSGILYIVVVLLLPTTRNVCTTQLKPGYELLQIAPHTSFTAPSMHQCSKGGGGRGGGSKKKQSNSNSRHLSSLVFAGKTITEVDKTS